MIRHLLSFKRRFPWIWSRVEDVNGVLFHFHYRGLGRIATETLADVVVAGCRFSLLEEKELGMLEGLLSRQGEESLSWFQPHAFDSAALKRLCRNPAFLMMKVTTPEGEMVGYFFLRCFFIGRAFIGLLVDAPFRNRGIGTAMWASCAEICNRGGLKMQATISTDNKPSMASCRKGTDSQQVQALEDHYLVIECKRKIK
ncbi:MAG: GNAT family N-acetyltransferase [Bacteroidales bacterium]|nr:GNAT family N-acetyltransferase [Bacteroidales bacterium]